MNSPEVLSFNYVYVIFLFDFRPSARVEEKIETQFL